MTGHLQLSIGEVSQRAANHVDRPASAWLTQRFVDAGESFEF